MRHLVTIRQIEALEPIEGADKIEVATIDGWKLVVRKGEFVAGQACVYFEIDSFLPETDERFAFLMKSGVRTQDGARGHRLKTIKLRGQISQGLALPTTGFPEFNWTMVDADLAALIGVTKWDPPVPAQLAGRVKGNFPDFIRKTDQERAQNMVRDIFEDNRDALYEITIKLDGSSCTIYHYNGVVGVCSRNLDLKVDDPDNQTNSFIATAQASGLLGALERSGANVAIQAELMGPGIQGNRENLKAHQLFVFDVWDIAEQRYMSRSERWVLLELLSTDGASFKTAPYLYPVARSLEELGIVSIADLIVFAEGPSLAHPVREGLVFKRIDGQFSFKTISNTFLMGEE